MEIRKKLASLSWTDWAVLTGASIVAGEVIKWFAKEVGKDFLFGTITDLIRPWIVEMIGAGAGQAVASSVVPYFVGFLIIAFVAWWFGRRKTLPAANTATTEIADATSDNPQHKIRLSEALDLVVAHYRSSWGLERAVGAHLMQASDRLREAAARGQITIEGRREINRDHPVGDRFSRIWEDIDKEYWRAHAFDLAAVLDGSAHWQTCETMAEVPGDLAAEMMPGYAGLRVLESAILHKWPPPPMRQPDDELDRLRRDIGRLTEDLGNPNKAVQTREESIERYRRIERSDHTMWNQNPAKQLRRDYLNRCDILLDGGHSTREEWQENVKDMNDFANDLEKELSRS